MTPKNQELCKDIIEYGNRKMTCFPATFVSEKIKEADANATEYLKAELKQKIEKVFFDNKLEHGFHSDALSEVLALFDSPTKPEGLIDKTSKQTLDLSDVSQKDKKDKGTETGDVKALESVPSNTQLLGNSLLFKEGYKEGERLTLEWVKDKIKKDVKFIGQGDGAIVINSQFIDWDDDKRTHKTLDVLYNYMDEFLKILEEKSK